MSSVKNQSLKKFARSSLSLLLIQSGLMGKPSILLEPSGTERNVMSLLTNTKGSLKVLLTRRSLTNTCFTTLLMCPLQSNQFCISQAPTTKNKALCKKQWMCIFSPAKSLLKRSVKTYFPTICASSRVLLTAKTYL